VHKLSLLLDIGIITITGIIITITIAASIFVKTAAP